MEVEDKSRKGRRGVEFFRPPSSRRPHSSAPCGTQQLTEATGVFQRRAGRLAVEVPGEKASGSKAAEFPGVSLLPPSGGATFFCVRTFPLLLVKHEALRRYMLIHFRVYRVKTYFGL